MSFLIVRRRDLFPAIEKGGEVHIFNGAKREFRQHIDPHQDFVREFKKDEAFSGAKKSLVVAIQTAFPDVRFKVEARYAFGENKFYELYLIFEPGEEKHGHGSSEVGEVTQDLLRGNTIPGGQGENETPSVY